METDKLLAYVRQFCNKAIHNGGFTADDGRNIANALDHLELKLSGGPVADGHDQDQEEGDNPS